MVSPDAEKEAKHIKFPTDRECIMKQLKRKPKIHKHEIEKGIKINKLVEFVRLYNPFDSDEYIRDVSESFVKIFDNEPNKYKDTVRFYIALCSVESNFRMVQNNSGSSAFGICQVIYKYHGQYINELGISKEHFYTSTYHNIYAGYKVFWAYAKNAKGIKKGTFRYRGCEDIKYYQKIYERYLKVLEYI